MTISMLITRSLVLGAALGVAAASSGAARAQTSAVGQTRSVGKAADLVLRNGKIVTLDDRKPEAQAIAISGDTIAAVGSNEEIQPYVGASTRVIDVKGALAIPGLIDGHLHFTGVGQARSRVG